MNGPIDEFERRLDTLPRRRTELLPALLLAQETCGYVSDPVVERIAAHLRLTANEVEGVATAYPDLRREPPGRRTVCVCTGAACTLAGAGRILDVLEADLGIHVGQTTPDGAVTLRAVPCAFVCAVAPVVEVDGACHGRVTEAAARELVATAQAQSATREGGDG